MVRRFIIPMLLLAAGSSQAQTSVTLYGVADASLRFDHTNVGTLRSVQSGGESGSRWGLKGSEDLGSGLSATFVFEQGVDITDNGVQQGNVGAGASGGLGGSSTAAHSSTGSRLFSRTSTVGIKGNFGELRFGRDYNPLFYTAYYADPFGAGLVGQIANVQTNNTVRSDNALYFDSPVFAGFQASGEWQFGESTTSNTVLAATGQAKHGNDRYGASVRYAAGPLYAGVATEQIRSNLDVYRQRSYVADATYDFTVFKVAASYWRTKNDNPNAFAAFGSTVATNQTSYFVGVTIPFGAWTILGGIAHLRDASSSNVSGVNLGKPKANFMAAAGRYSLSKRTILYAAYARFNLQNGPGGNPFVGFGGILDAGGAGLYNSANLNGPNGSNVNPYSYQVGIRQSF